MDGFMSVIGSASIHQARLQSTFLTRCLKIRPSSELIPLIYPLPPPRLPTCLPPQRTTPPTLLPSAPSAVRFFPPQTRCGCGCADAFLDDREAERELKSHRGAHGERTGLIPSSCLDVLGIPAAFYWFRVARKRQNQKYCI